MPTLTKNSPDGRPVTITTDVPRELITLRSQGFREKPESEEELEELTVKDLRDELASRDLPKSGSKAELVERLARTAPSAGSTQAATTAPDTQAAAGK